MPAINHHAKLATALTAALAGASGLVGLVSTRIYGGRAAQGSALPRLIWHEISSSPDYCHDSGTTGDAGIEETIVQFDIEARTLSGCRAVASAIAGALQGASLTYGQAHLQACFREPGGFAQPMDHDTGDGVAEAHRLSVDYRFLWRDA